MRKYAWRICACGSTFKVDHSLPCLKGGFPSLSHNEVCHFKAEMLTEACPICLNGTKFVAINW